MAPGQPSEHDTTRAAVLRASLDDSGISSRQLWAETLNLGTFLTPAQVRECLAGRQVPSDHEYVVLTHVLHEAVARVPTGLNPPDARPRAAQIPRSRAGR